MRATLHEFMIRVKGSYVGRISRLALLAPDIVEVIVHGDEPNGLSLERLTTRVPVLWAEQREPGSGTSRVGRVTSFQLCNC